jgi:quercetin dioxygenase-like cupin family protein
MQKSRWSKVYESPEEELVQHLQSRSIEAARIVAEAGSGIISHTAEAATVIWCAEGSLYVKSPGANISMQPGDTLRINAHTDYDLLPGISGYVCYVAD